MITHCPSCHTHFRVRAEQLAVRAGQVRCGKCNRVFDALEYLSEDLAAAREFSADPAAAAGGAGVAADAAPAYAAIRAGEPQEPATAADADADAMHAATGTPGTAAPDDAPAEFDFGPMAAAGPGKRARRWPWVLGALLLLLVLLAQATYQYRSAVMVLFPQAKPHAAALCARLGCELPLPQRIELISIEASDLQADTSNPAIMVLAATLKNRAIFDQQLPMLELTLTDAQDQPVVRRVLAAQDYIGKAVNLQAGFAANSEIAIKVFIEGSQVKATGYRLYLFYP